MKRYLTNPAVLWVALLGSVAGEVFFREFFAPLVSLRLIGGITIVNTSLPLNPMALAVWDRLPDAALDWLFETVPTWLPLFAGGAALVGALNGGLVGSLLVWGVQKWPHKRDEAAYALNLARSQREPEWRRCLKRPTVLWWLLLGSIVGPAVLEFLPI
jgi:hypothetical protein